MPFSQSKHWWYPIIKSTNNSRQVIMGPKYQKKSCSIKNCTGQNCPFPHPETPTFKDSPLLPKQKYCGAIPPVPRLFPALPFRLAKKPDNWQATGPAPLVRCCRSCGRNFVLALEKQQWYHEKHLSLPRRCEGCREVRREAAWSFLLVVMLDCKCRHSGESCQIDGWHYFILTPTNLILSSLTTAVRPCNASSMNYVYLQCAEEWRDKAFGKISTEGVDFDLDWILSSILRTISNLFRASTSLTFCAVV